MSQSTFVRTRTLSAGRYMHQTGERFLRFPFSIDTDCDQLGANICFRTEKQQHAIFTTLKRVFNVQSVANLASKYRLKPELPGGFVFNVHAKSCCSWLQRRLATVTI